MITVGPRTQSWTITKFGIIPVILFLNLPHNPRLLIAINHKLTFMNVLVIMSSYIDSQLFFYLTGITL